MHVCPRIYTCTREWGNPCQTFGSQICGMVERWCLVLCQLWKSYLTISHGLLDSAAILRALRSWHEFWATINDKSRSIRLYIAIILPKIGSWCAERSLALLAATVRYSWPNSDCRYCLISNISEDLSPGLRTRLRTRCAPDAVAPLIKSDPTVSWSFIHSL